jgi:hypothetical protein
MTQTIHCPLCGSDKVEPGKLESTGQVHFRPDNAKFLKAETANVDVTGLLCTRCGTITLLGGSEKMVRLTETSASSRA